MGGRMKARGSTLAPGWMVQLYTPDYLLSPEIYIHRGADNAILL